MEVCVAPRENRVVFLIFRGGVIRHCMTLLESITSSSSSMVFFGTAFSPSSLAIHYPLSYRWTFSKNSKDSSRKRGGETLLAASGTNGTAAIRTGAVLGIESCVGRLSHLQLMHLLF
ncbi:hypothetical protein Fot_03616 [Forsythia ovata]|uniref:Uncharacterized protein n=1 Tax=Forsythia ovata TaxID=205694 RepID=A0ABD1XAA2_9LAMI